MDIFYVMRLQVLLTFVLFVTASASCLAQNRQLRYIASYPNYNLTPNQTNDDWNVVYTSAILKQQGDSLVEAQTLCDSMHKLYYLRYYPDQNTICVLVAGKEGKYGNFVNDSLSLMTINTQTLQTSSIKFFDTLRVSGNEYHFFKSELRSLDFQGKLKYAVLYSDFNTYQLSKRVQPNYLYYLLDPETGQFKRTEPSYYRYLTTNGSNSGPYLSYNEDSFPLQSDTILNLLRIPSELEIDSVYTTLLPPGVKLSKYGAFLIINDSIVRVLYFYEYNSSEILVHVYRKKDGAWQKLKLPSSGQNQILMKNFNGWLTGSIKVKGERGALKLKKDQPGQEFWSRARTKYSPSIYEILEAHEPLWYSEGILYIYNVDTKTYIQWDTKQADSEILLVENGKVYYRKYDEIYEVPIVKGKSLGKHRLVVKNKYVPAIHFMFMTKGSK